LVIDVSELEMLGAIGLEARWLELMKEKLCAMSLVGSSVGLLADIYHLFLIKILKNFIKSLKIHQPNSVSIRDVTNASTTPAP
jgi:hypothetical protein